MNSSVAIAMIVCGTILIALPYIHNTIAMQQVSSAMIALNKTVNLTADIPKHAGTVCVFGGIIMIVVGAVAGLRNKEN
jgi:hypothetical protein